MKTVIYNSILIAICFFISSRLTAQPQIEVVKINDNISLLPVYSVNTMLYTDGDDVLMIDAGYEQIAELLSNKLTEMNIGNVDYLINTHWHFDHVSGNKFFGKDAVVISHSSVRDLLAKDEMLLGELQKAHSDSVLPDISTRSKFSLYLGNEEIKIIPLIGGHSEGDLVIHFVNSNVAHIGDIIFSDMFPFVDVDHGGSVIQLADNLLKIIEIFPADVRIFPGHGREMNIDDVKKYHEMVIKTTSLVRSAMEDEKTLEEIIENEILKEWEIWGKAFTCKDWIEMIYNSIMKQNAHKNI